MGEDGPCGPCSEVFYDHGDHISGGPPGSPDEDGDRFVEIWNLVFMQYEQEAGEITGNLPKPSIDTRSEEHTSELQSLMRISYAVFCLKKKNQNKEITRQQQTYKDTRHKNT